MSEELKNEEKKVEEKVEDKTTEATAEVEYTEVEQEAMEQGWLPEDKWVEAGNDAKDHRSAREFKERGDFFKTIHQLKRENKQLSSQQSSLLRHHKLVFEQAHKKALQDLKRERRQALMNEDVDKVENIEEQIEQAESEFETQKKQFETELEAPAQGTEHPDFVAWKARNVWYDEAEELRDEADAIGMVYSRKHPGTAPENVLRHVEKEIKKRFPEKFGGKRTAPNAVQGVDRTNSARRKSEPDYTLTDTEQYIMDGLVRDGVMTKEEYVKSLKAYDKKRG